MYSSLFCSGSRLVLVFYYDLKTKKKWKESFLWKKPNATHITVVWYYDDSFNGFKVQ